MEKNHDFPSRHQREITTIESASFKRRWRDKIAKDVAEFQKTRPIIEEPLGKTILPFETEDND